MATESVDLIASLNAVRTAVKVFSLGQSTQIISFEEENGPGLITFKVRHKGLGDLGDIRLREKSQNLTNWSTLEPTYPTEHDVLEYEERLKCYSIDPEKMELGFRFGLWNESKEKWLEERKSLPVIDRALWVFENTRIEDLPPELREQISGSFLPLGHGPDKLHTALSKLSAASDTLDKRRSEYHQEITQACFEQLRSEGIKVKGEHPVATQTGLLEVQSTVGAQPRHKKRIRATIAGLVAVVTAVMGLVTDLGKYQIPIALPPYLSLSLPIWIILLFPLVVLTFILFLLE